MRTREMNSFKMLLLEQRTEVLNRMIEFRAETLAPVGERGDEGDRATHRIVIAHRSVLLAGLCGARVGRNKFFCECHHASV